MYICRVNEWQGGGEKEGVELLWLNVDCEDSPMTNESYTKRRTETKEDKI